MSPEGLHRDEYADVETKCNDYLLTKQKVQYEVYVFRKATQLPGEHLDVHNNRLRMLAKHCEFGDVDN